MLTNINTTIEDKGVNGKIDEANSSRQDLSENIIGLTAEEKANTKNQTTIQATKGGTTEGAGVHTSIANSTITAKNNTNINAIERNDISMHGGNATGGAISASGSVGLLTAKHATDTTINQTTIKGKNISINALQENANANAGIKLNLYQGSAGIYSLGAAYGKVITSGSTAVSITNAPTIDINSPTINAKENLTIQSVDSSTTESNAYGLSAGSIAAGAIVAQVENSSNTSISTSNTKLTASKISIGSEKKNTVKAKAVSGSIGVASANAAAATAIDKGNSSIILTGTSTITTPNLNIQAYNAPNVSAIADSIAGSLLFSGGVSFAKATADGNAEVKIAENDSDNVNIDANAIKISSHVGALNNSSTTVESKVVGIGASGYAGLNVNLAESNANMSATTTLGKISYAPASNLTVEATRSVQTSSNAKGLTISGLFASGTNKATATNTSKANVKLAGGTTTEQAKLLNSLTINADGYTKNTLSADGSGGAIVAISPLAAVTESKLSNTSKTSLSGYWNVHDGINVSATQKLATDIDTNTLSAAVIAGSGAQANSTINSDTSIVLDSANIKTGKAQNYRAENILDIKNTLKASGYGAGAVAAASQSTNIDLKGTINTNQTNLHTTGNDSSIVLQALTSGNVNNQNTIKSAGVVAGTFAKSDSNIKYNNSVDAKKSIIQTDGFDADIVLVANDNTNVTLDIVADTQGGAVGAASANNASIFNRSNAVKVGSGSKLNATRDINLYTSKNAVGDLAILNYNITANAYNKTAIPLKTTPNISNTMTQNNTVLLDGDAESVRHINISSGKGISTVARAALEYKWAGGTSGTGSLTSSINGQQSADETTTNKITINGNATAGVHNKLTLDIDGQIYIPVIPENSPVPNEDIAKTQASLDNFKLVVGTGSEWFKTTDWYKNNVATDGKIKLSSKDLSLALLERYNELSQKIKDYSRNTQNYIYLNAELDKILVILEESGFASNKSVNNKTVPAFSLPDLAVSGGNINLDTDQMVGTGHIVAKGNPQITITNKSDAYLDISNSIKIADSGGNIKVNDIAYNANNPGILASFKNANRIAIDALSPTVTPTIKIASTANARKGVQADIDVSGDIINSAGDINITNANFNINILDGNIKGRNINLSAPKGSVSQSSKEGLINIGGSPTERYKISNDIDFKIKKFFNNKNEIKEFESWDKYITWVKDTTTDIGLTDNEKALINQLANDPKRNSAGIVAGGSIFINGKDVNINGLIQSGFDTYSATIDNDALRRIIKLDNNKSSNTLLDSNVLGNSYYRIHGGDSAAVYDSAQNKYIYNVPLYYNPATRHILVDNINVKGGKIFITGAIASTGNGRILAADKAANISIDTQLSDRDLLLSGITNNDVQGLIKITDTNYSKQSTNAPLVTEYTRGSQKSYWQDDANKTNVYLGSNISKYKASDNLSYTWTGGLTSQNAKHYSYSEKFVFWGLIDWGAQELMTKTYTLIKDTSSNNKNMIKAELISPNSPVGKELKIESTTNLGTDPLEYSRVVVDKVYDGLRGKILGYGKKYYSWSILYGTSTDIIYKLNASRDIGVGFLNSGTDQIQIKSTGNILLKDTVASATHAGAVGLGSLKGMVSNVSGNMSTINTDALTVSAATGVNLQHQSISDKASIDLVTKQGNIDFKSHRGDLLVNRSATGLDKSIVAESGNVTLQAHGSILDNRTDNAVTIKAKRVDLTSQTGSIGTKEKALVVDSGSIMYDADSMSSTVNATASKDIVLTRTTDGNMRLGEIKSENGDVILSVQNGSFVDGLRDTENADKTSTDKKVSSWLNNGLIHKNDADGESTNAATNAKQTRVAVLELQAGALKADNQQTLARADNETLDAYLTKLKTQAKSINENEEVKTLRQAYIQTAGQGNSAAADDALTAYQNKQKSLLSDYANSEKEWIVSWAEVNHKDAEYGWSKNQLLYAIQSSIINTAPGDVQYVKTANVTGNNITLNAANGSIGINKESKVIAYDKISEIDNLKTLAAAKAGDLTWSNANKSVSVRQQQAINVALNQANGQLNAVGKENVYLAGKEGTSFNISNINTQGDIKLMSQKGVFATSNNPISIDTIVNGNVTPTLTGKSLIITGGKDSVGTKASMITTNLSGTIDANSSQGVYIYQVGDHNLTLQNVVGKELYIAAKNDILMTTEEGKDMGYLNSASSINLRSDNGSIGNSEHGIRILNNDATINATATNDINLDGKESGNMLLGTISAAKVLRVNSDGNIQIGRNEVKTGDTVITPEVVGNIQFGEDSNLTATNKIGINGLIHTSNDKALTLTAKESSIESTNKGIIQVKTLNTNSKNAVVLESQDNAFDVLNVAGYNNKDIEGNVLVKTNSNALVVDIKNTVNGNIMLTNLKTDGTLTINNPIVAKAVVDNGNIVAGRKGSIDLSAKGTVTVKGIDSKNTITASDYVDIKALNGDILVQGNVSAGTSVVAKATEGSVNVTGNIDSQNGDTAITALDSKSADDKGNILIGGALTSAKNIALNSTNGDITVNGEVTAKGGNVDTTATDTGNISFNKSVTASNDINATTKKGNVVLNGNTTAGQNVNTNTQQGNININGAVVATQGNVNLVTAVEGNITVGHDGQNDGSITAGKAANLRTATGDIDINGSITAQTGALLQVATKGNIDIDGSTTVQGVGNARLLNKDGNININGSVTTNNGNIDAQAEHGAILVKGTVTSADFVNMKAVDGGITTEGAVTAKNYIHANATNGGVTLKGNTVSQDKEVDIKALNGDILVQGNVSAGTSVVAKATEGSVNVTGNIDSQNGDTAITALDSKSADDKGNILIGGALTSAKNIALNSTNGDITVNGEVTAKGGNVDTTATDTGNISFNKSVTASNDINAITKKGNIEFQGLVQANRDINAKASQQGNILFNGAVSADRNIVANSQISGDISIRKNITSSLNTSLTTHNGSILLHDNDDANSEDITVTSKNGNINLLTTGTGDIKDTHRSINGDRGFLRASNGNTTVEHKGVGDIDLYEIFAQKAARVSANDGNITLNTINGDIVSIIVKNPEKKFDVKNIVAGTVIENNANSIEIETIEQRPGYNNTLTFITKGSSDDTPINKLNIGDIKTNKGLRFRHLWVKDSKVKASKGGLLFDKLYVLNKGAFSNSTTTINVFGSAPENELKVQGAYWNNTAINNPKNNLNEWLLDSPNPRWANLNFIGQNNVHYATGNLLNLSDHYYAYSQRYTQTSWMRLFMLENFYGVNNMSPIVSKYASSNLISYKNAPTKNAKLDELKID